MPISPNNPIDPTQILDHFDDVEYLKRFIATSHTATTANMNMTRVASEIFLGRMLRDSENNLERAFKEMSESLDRALANHAEALNESARASDRHASSLKWATWALFLATVGLFAVACVQLLLQFLPRPG